MEDKEKKSSFGRRLLIFFISVFAVFGLLSMILCVINPLISPNRFVLTSYFGLAFWPIFIFNLLMLLFLIFLKAKKAFLYPILALVVSIPGFLRSYSVKKAATEEGNIKIVSYNVGHTYDENNMARDKKSIKEDIINIINEINPDIVCLQESVKFNKKALEKFANRINFKYYSNDLARIVIFSKYPIEDDTLTEKFKNTCKFGSLKIVNAGGLGKFYVGCVHLQSYGLTNEEIEYVNDTKHYINNSETTGKSLISKLKYGFEKRTENTKTIVENMPANGIPIIICGDFNDTPMSYTYNQMRKAGLKDAFLKVGHGLGTTYNGELPMLRIDYIWYSENVVPMTFTRLKKKMSDHYPIIMTFNVTH